MTMTVRLLGAVEASSDGHVLAVGGGRQRRLLAHLALAPGRTRSTDSVIDALWPDDSSPTDARQSVHAAVSRLRSAFGNPAVVVARGGGYALEGVEVDAVLFADHVTSARSESTDESRVDLLKAALGLWRGNAIEEFASEEWARPDAVRLDEMRAHASDELGDALVRLSRFDEAVIELEAAAARSPLRERTHRGLMDALDASGRTAEALRVFQAYRNRLATDLGLAPGSEIANAESEIAAGTRLHSTSDSKTARSYQLGERIGSGSFAVVYRGRQPMVDRDVAVKMIRADLADQPDFISRFESEAQLVARLEHPHIVPLYDFWREPGAAYLVMRLLRGGTLEQQLRLGALETVSLTRLITQVGAALDAAHRAGVVHRDVRPANILTDDDGNYYLSDFGIASALEVFSEHVMPVAASGGSTGETTILLSRDRLASIGSPAYASPEQLRGSAGQVGPATDLYAFAICVFEALAGRLPYNHARTVDELVRCQLEVPLPHVRELSPEVPAAIDEVFARATAKDPAARYRSVAEFVADARTALGPESFTPPVPEVLLARNPYKGLRAFGEADIADFFGCEDLVGELVARVVAQAASSNHTPNHTPPTKHNSRFLAVVGPSGSGKSSAVRAGLVPALRADQSWRWLITTMIPGNHPFEELAVALTRIATSSNVDADELSRPRGVARTLKALCPDDVTRIVVVVDQAEELFTLASEDERTMFLDQLVEAADDERVPAHVVMTLRADFFDRALNHSGLTRLLAHATVPVGSLDDDALTAAITRPATNAGASFEAGLVDAIKREVTAQPGGLPLLQYALTELFDRHVNGVLTHGAWTSLGGLGGSLARRADALLDDDENVAGARQMFTRLVTLGDGVEDTRRRVRRTELPGGRVADARLDRFSKARLLTFDNDPASREPTVELAHEALITRWPRLREWLQEDRDGLRTLAQVRTAANSWSESGRDYSELYRGARLELVSSQLANRSDDLAPLEAEFLDASHIRARREREAEEKSARRIRRSLVGVACLAVASLIAGSIAWQSRQRATRSVRRTETARLAASAPALAESNLALGLLAAAESYRREPSSETLGSLQRAMISQDRILGFLGSGRSYVAVEIAGSTVYGLRAGSIDRWDVNTFRELKPLRIPEGELIDPLIVQRRRFSVGKDFAAVRYGDSSAALVNLNDGSRRALPKAVAAAVSPDGTRVALVAPNLAVELVDTADLRTLWKTPVPKEQTFADQASLPGPPGVARPELPLLAAVGFVGKGDVLSGRSARVQRLAVDDGRVIFDVARRFASPKFGERFTLGGLGGVTWIRTDGDRVVSGSVATIGEWDARDPQSLDPVFVWRGNASITGFNADIVALSPGRAAIAHVDGTIEEVDLNTGERRGPVIDSQVGAVQGLGSTASGHRVVVAGSEGIALMSFNGDRLLARAFPSRQGGGYAFGAPTRGGWSAFVDSPPQLGDEASPSSWAFCPGDSSVPCRTMSGPEKLRSENWVASRERLAVWDRNGDQVVVKPRGRSEREVAIRNIGRASGPSVSPLHGPWMAQLTSPTPAPGILIRVVDMRTATEIAQVDLSGLDQKPGWDGFASPDGREFLLVNRITGDSREIDTKTWTLLKDPPFSDKVVGGSFDQAGNRVFTAGKDGTYTVRSWPDKTVLRQFPGEDGLTNLWSDGGSEFFENPRFLATAFDLQGRLWDIEEGKPVGVAFPGEAGGVGVAPIPVIFSHITNEYGLIWDLEVTKWFDRACTAAGRNMTRLEWERNGPRDSPYQATCPQWPAAPA